MSWYSKLYGASSQTELDKEIQNAILKVNIEKKRKAGYRDIVNIVKEKTGDRWSPETICREARKLAEEGIIKKFSPGYFYV